MVLAMAMATMEVYAKAEAQPFWGHPYGLLPEYYGGPKCDEERCDSCMKDFATPVDCRRECLACKDCKGEEGDSEYCSYCEDGYFACTRTCFQKQDICIGCAPKCNLPKCDEAQCADCMENFPEPIFAKNCFKECTDACKDESDMCKDGFFACSKMCMKAQDQCLYCAPRCEKPKEEAEEWKNLPIKPLKHQFLISSTSF